MDPTRLARQLGLRVLAKSDAVRLRRVKDPLKRARGLLSPELLRPVEWTHGDLELEELATSRYFRTWKQFQGGHKKYSYFELYDRLFEGYCDKRPRVLEVGVYKGASLQAWKRYFGEGSVIVGIDVDPACEQFDDATNGVHVRVGSQADTGFLERVCRECGPFDIIIDDGSHFTRDVIATFNFAFLHCLTDGGIYFIEDLNTSYWKKYRTSRRSAMDMVLVLSEMTHQFYVVNDYLDYSRENYKKSYTSPRIATLVSEVRVFDSAAAIYKKSHYPPLVFHT